MSTGYTPANTWGEGGREGGEGGGREGGRRGREKGRGREMREGGTLSMLSTGKDHQK